MAENPKANAGESQIGQSGKSDRPVGEDERAWDIVARHLYANPSLPTIPIIESKASGGKSEASRVDAHAGESGDQPSSGEKPASGSQTPAPAGPSPEEQRMAFKRDLFYKQLYESRLMLRQPQETI